MHLTTIQATLKFLFLPNLYPNRRNASACLRRSPLSQRDALERVPGRGVAAVGADADVTQVPTFD